MAYCSKCNQPVNPINGSDYGLCCDEVVYVPVKTDED